MPPLHDKSNFHSLFKQIPVLKPILDLFCTLSKWSASFELGVCPESTERSYFFPWTIKGAEAY